MGRRKRNSKRIIPDSDLIIWRESFLKKLAELKAVELDAPEYLLEQGNSKIGFRSIEFEKVWVWNLPPVVSCPGSSKWCLSHCYNADQREDKFPIQSWLQNWSSYLQFREQTEAYILNELNSSNAKSIMRIHSSGDFFSNDYIEMWINIVSSRPSVMFWAYTRSWADSNLLKSLEKLRKLPNMQLFASVDSTMIEPPKNWRLSYVYSKDAEIDLRGLICPEQSDGSIKCIDCKYCITKGEGNVLFALH